DVVKGSSRAQRRGRAQLRGMPIELERCRSLLGADETGILKQIDRPVVAVVLPLVELAEPERRPESVGVVEVAGGTRSYGGDRGPQVEEIPENPIGSSHH